jgi:hypothetical protein
MKSQPVTITTINGTSTPAKRTLFRIALSVALVGTMAVSTILIVQGGFALGRLRSFVDIGLYPFYLTSVLVFIIGLLSLIAFIILTIGLIKLNRTLAAIAAVLLGICSIGLIAISICSFLTITSGELPASINNVITKELDQTQYSVSPENNIIVENTHQMAKLEKQYRCCGLSIPLNDYGNRQPSIFGSLTPSSSSGSGGSSGRGRGSSTQRNTAAFGSAVPLPISCCNEKFRSADNLCVDMFANYTSPLNRYNTKGCYDIVRLYKYERVKYQGFTTIIAACLAVISCIALAAVIRLLGEGYQIVPLRAAT